MKIKFAWVLLVGFFLGNVGLLLANYKLKERLEKEFQDAHSAQMEAKQVMTFYEESKNKIFY